MNAYGHRPPQYPYPKDDLHHFNPNTYQQNPVPHPVNTMGVSSVNSNFHPNYKYTSRHPHEPSKFSNFDKEVPSNNVEYARGGWSNGNVSEPAPEKYYSVNVPPANTQPSYQTELKPETCVPKNFKPEHNTQSNWDNPVNQYSNVRLAIFLENCNVSYDLLESDLRELFSYYSGVHSLYISPEYPAAELVLTDPNACKTACSDLNGVVLHGIGTLRCVVMLPGQSLNSLMSTANVYQNFNKPTSSNSSASTVDNPNLRYSYNEMKNTNGHGKVNHPRPLTVNNVEHVVGMTNRPNTNRLCRFELIELFSFEPDFDVTAQILGPNNTNIEYIMKNANNKVDISIKGKPLNSASATDRLHITISSNDFYSYNKAIFMTEDLLCSVCEKYVEFVRERGKMVSNLIGFCRHEYEEDNSGKLDYKGSLEKPKTWLENNNKRFNNQKFNHYRNNFSKKVNDRSRPIPPSRNQNQRIPANPRNRGFRK
uniref:KHDC4/BBP-like KH-domain type I domain-containing protein n=1 Tax=Theileria annulata TaxID=5874 RepID=A0A3B0MWS7_THEAN